MKSKAAGRLIYSDCAEDFSNNVLSTSLVSLISRFSGYVVALHNIKGSQRGKGGSGTTQSNIKTILREDMRNGFQAVTGNQAVLKYQLLWLLITYRVSFLGCEDVSICCVHSAVVLSRRRFAGIAIR